MVNPFTLRLCRVRIDYMVILGMTKFTLKTTSMFMNSVHVDLLEPSL
jgi:hypothetical protein